jgi:hypothetical protein
MLGNVRQRPSKRVLYRQSRKFTDKDRTLNAIFTEVEVNLRPTVSRPVCLGVRHPSGTRDQFFFLLEMFFRQFRVSCCGAPSLMRGLVCNLLVKLLLGLGRAVTLESKSLRTHGHILLSHLRLPQPGGPGSSIYIPQEQGGPVIPPGTVFLFVASYDSQGYDGGILTRLHTGGNLYCFTQTVRFQYSVFLLSHSTDLLLSHSTACSF